MDHYTRITHRCGHSVLYRNNVIGVVPESKLCTPCECRRTEEIATHLRPWIETKRGRWEVAKYIRELLETQYTA